MDYNKEFSYGNVTISRNDYESMPSPMNTSSLSDNEMDLLAEFIYVEMIDYRDWLASGEITQDKYDEKLWEVMESLGLSFGMTYYEDLF